MAPITALSCVLVVACLVGGCARREVVRPTAPAEPEVGYAYTAVLMEHHPLYQALAKLDWTIQMLASDKWAAPPVTFERRAEAVLSLEPYTRPPDYGGMTDLRARWLSQYGQMEPFGVGLSRDLLAGIEWQREQARQHVQDALADARAQASRELAQLQARLVRDQQERLNNLELDLSAPEAEVALRASRERERVWQMIREQVAAEKEASEKRLAALERRLEAEAAARLSTAEQAGRDVMRQRAGEMQRVGDALHAEMTDAMRHERAQETGSVRPRRVEPTEANARLATAEQMRDEATAAREETVLRQLERLRRAEARLQGKVKRSTEVRALAVAQRRNLDVQLLPGGARRGRDMTEAIAADLDKLWNAAHR